LRIGARKETKVGSGCRHALEGGEETCLDLETILEGGPKDTDKDSVDIIKGNLTGSETIGIGTEGNTHQEMGERELAQAQILRISLPVEGEASVTEWPIKRKPKKHDEGKKEGRADRDPISLHRARETRGISFFRWGAGATLWIQLQIQISRGGKEGGSEHRPHKGGISGYIKKPPSKSRSKHLKGSQTAVKGEEKRKKGRRYNRKKRKAKAKSGAQSAPIELKKIGNPK